MCELAFAGAVLATLLVMCEYAWTVTARVMSPPCRILPVVPRRHGIGVADARVPAATRTRRHPQAGVAARAEVGRRAGRPAAHSR